jgi:hypothetical protein
MIHKCTHSWECVQLAGLKATAEEHLWACGRKRPRDSLGDAIMGTPLLWELCASFRIHQRSKCVSLPRTSNAKDSSHIESCTTFQDVLVRLLFTALLKCKELEPTVTSM